MCLVLQASLEKKLRAANLQKRNAERSNELSAVMREVRLLRILPAQLFDAQGLPAVSGSCIGLTCHTMPDGFATSHDFRLQLRHQSACHVNLQRSVCRPSSRSWRRSWRTRWTPSRWSRRLTSGPTGGRPWTSTASSRCPIHAAMT